MNNLAYALFLIQTPLSPLTRLDPTICVETLLKLLGDQFSIGGEDQFIIGANSGITSWKNFIIMLI